MWVLAIGGVDRDKSGEVSPKGPGRDRDVPFLLPGRQCPFATEESGEVKRCYLSASALLFLGVDLLKWLSVGPERHFLADKAVRRMVHAH